MMKPVQVSPNKRHWLLAKFTAATMQGNFFLQHLGVAAKIFVVCENCEDASHKQMDNFTPKSNIHYHATLPPTHIYTQIYLSLIW